MSDLGLGLSTVKNHGGRAGRLFNFSHVANRMGQKLLLLTLTFI